MTGDDVDDHAYLDITPDGMLKFTEPHPDYETPKGTPDSTPTESDNTYRVVVQANDGGTERRTDITR